MAEQRQVVRKLAAILAADVAGFSLLMGADEEGTLARLNAHRRELIDRKIAEHRGRIVKTTGDGLLVEFASVVDAVRCAVEIQRGMAERNDSEPADRRIRFRIGVNIGDIIVEDDDIYGDGVNVAARLQTLAEPGGICVARTVAEQVQDKLNFAFRDMGPQTVKNIVRPVQVMRVILDAEGVPPALRPVRTRRAPPPLILAAAGVLIVAAIAAGAWYRLHPPSGAGSGSVAVTAPPAAIAPWPTAMPPPGGPSIAILPFANLSGAEQQSVLADGLTEDILTELAQVSGLFVAARNATASYKGAAVDISKTGQALGVRYVLEGSVRRADDRVRVTAQLIEVASGSHIWADRYDQPVGEALKVEDAMTESITTQLVVQMRHRDLELARGKAAGARTAYDDYLLGKDALARSDLAGDTKARDMFAQAIAIDAGYAPAYGGIALVDLRDFVLDRGALQGDAALAHAFDTAQHALALDPNASDAQEVVAAVFLFRHRYSQAIDLLTTVIARTADDAGLGERLGQVYIFAGDPERGLATLQRIIRLNPYHAQAVFADLARAAIVLQRPDDAIAQAEVCTSRASGYRPCFEAAAVAYVDRGRDADARAAVERIRALDPRAALARVPATLPFKRPADLDRFLDGLRKAGLN